MENGDARSQGLVEVLLELSLKIKVLQEVRKQVGHDV